MSQIAFWKATNTQVPEEALLRCFADVADVNATTFAISPLTATAGLRLWSWRAPNVVVLMTQSLLEEGDEDDQPRRTTHGVVARVERDGTWLVALSDASESVERVLAQVLDEVTRLN